MKNLLELHILQNFAPSNLNRDDTGSPKDALFGGSRRLRISSQCLKRAAREYVRDWELLPDEVMAFRTKRLSKVIGDQLVEKFGVESVQASAIGRVATDAILKTETKKKGEESVHLSKVLVFFATSEAYAIAAICNENLEALTELASEAAEQARQALEGIREKIENLQQKLDELDKSEKEAVKAVKDETKEAKKEEGRIKKAAPKAEIPDEITKRIKEVFGKSKSSVDIAMFGRMLAEIPSEQKRDAACQVAHAISTNALEREFDYFTAVDELNPSGETGAGMLGTVEFGSSCFYRYVALDLEKLRENLQGDGELTLKGVEAFLTAIIKAKPSGKQNSFAAHNDPEYVAITVRQNADPRNLANAFERAVKSRDQSLTEASAELLEQKWTKLEAAYGQAGQTFVLKVEGETTVGQKVSGLNQMLERVLAQVQHNLGV